MAAAGALLLPKAARLTALQIAIDLNTVPPVGIEGIERHDKAGIAKLFEKNDQILDAEEVYALALD